MRIITLIDSDYESLKRYFGKLFELMKEEIESKRNISLQVLDIDDENLPESFFRFNHFIKPDMLINTYSFVDYWMKRLCEYHKKEKKLNLKYTHNGIKANNNLERYQKYLIQDCGLNLLNIENQLIHLDQFRVLRNSLIHDGGFATEHDEEKIKNIKGVSSIGSLIIIDDMYGIHLNLQKMFYLI